MVKVSIILPCYNVERFIGDAFQSIVRQSAFEHFEVIPVNDGSTDGTQRIIDEYQRRYPDRFFPVSFEERSGGPGRPRNAGIDKARGEYIIFMDPDDRVYQDGYSVLLQAMEKHHSDVVIAARYGVPEGKGPESKVWVDFLAPEEYVNDGSYRVKLDLLTQRPGILRSIYRTDAVRRHGLRFLEGIISSEDEIFDMKYLLLSQRITKINDIVYLYTVERGDSVTSKIRINLYEDLPIVFAGLHDALSVYFNQAVVSYRIASLLRFFYYPKLLNLDPDLTDAALDLVRSACDDYGFDRLLLTENRVDRQMLELLRERHYSQLMLVFMRLRADNALRRARRQTKIPRILRRPSAMAVAALLRYVRAARRAVADRAPWRFLLANYEWARTTKPNGYWLFMDRVDKAADNGEALYRYVRDNKIHNRIAFVVRKDSPDYERLRRDGFTLIAYDTLKHWRTLYACEHLFASHVDDIVIRPWKRYAAGPVAAPRFKLNFLQHGIIRSDLSGWLGTKTYNIFCSSARSEHDSLLDNIQYKLTPDEVTLTGLARHDLIHRGTGDYVLIFPTWRSFLTGASRSEFLKSEFYRAWHALLHDEKISQALAAAGMRIRFVLHSSLNRFRDCFQETAQVTVPSYDDIGDFSQLVSGAQMLVTDYSTLSFDVLYLRRSVVYYMFPEGRTHSTNVGANFDLYNELGTCLTDHGAVVDAIVAAVEQGFAVDERKVARIDEFFAYNDTGNRRRIIDAVLSKDTCA